MTHATRKSLQPTSCAPSIRENDLQIKCDYINKVTSPFLITFTYRLLPEISLLYVASSVT